MSADCEIYVLTVTLLLPPFGSLVVAELTVFICETDPVGCVAGNETVKVKFPVGVLTGKFPVYWHVNVANVQTQPVEPVGAVRAVAVAPAGTVSTILGFTDTAGPLLVIVCV